MTDIDNQELIASDEPAWAEWLAQFDDDAEAPEPDGVLVKALLDVRDLEAWVAFARDVMDGSDAFYMVRQPLNRFQIWLTQSALLALPAGSPELWSMRANLIRTAPEPDGGFASATELFNEMKEGGATDDALAETALLVVTGAITSRDYAAALEFAQEASRLFVASGNAERANFASRRLGAALLYNKHVEAAFQLFLMSMKQRGPLFGGGGASVLAPTDDPLEAAMDEAAMIATWATETTPEWIRAVGGLAEQWPDKAAYLWPVFETYATLMFETGHDPEQDIEVVVRQGGERGLVETPRRALAIYVRYFPDDDWASTQLEIISQHQQLHALVQLRDRDPETMIEGLLLMLGAMEDSGEMGESTLSFQVVDLLVDTLVDLKDQRAITVQRRILDYKVQKYGDCPAAWLEEQNLGTVLAQFGEYALARERLANALIKQRDFYGADHPHVQMTERNLAKLPSN